MVTRLLAAGATGGGQTSWGPTGFAFVESGREAERLVALTAKDGAKQGAQVTIVSGLDQGARNRRRLRQDCMRKH